MKYTILGYQNDLWQLKNEAGQRLAVSKKKLEEMKLDKNNIFVEAPKVNNIPQKSEESKEIANKPITQINLPKK